MNFGHHKRQEDREKQCHIQRHFRRNLFGVHQPVNHDDEHQRDAGIKRRILHHAHEVVAQIRIRRLAVHARDIAHPRVFLRVGEHQHREKGIQVRRVIGQPVVILPDGLIDINAQRVPQRAPRNQRRNGRSQISQRKDERMFRFIFPVNQPQQHNREEKDRLQFKGKGNRQHRRRAHGFTRLHVAQTHDDEKHIHRVTLPPARAVDEHRRQGQHDEQRRHFRLFASEKACRARHGQRQLHSQRSPKTA